MEEVIRPVNLRPVNVKPGYKAPRLTYIVNCQSRLSACVTLLDYMTVRVAFRVFERIFLEFSEENL